MGTGLGCGIIIGGQIYRGKGCYAGEIWNIPIENGDILENTVSIRAMKAYYRERGGRDLEPHEIYELYSQGDRTAAEAFELYGRAVGRVVATVMSFLDPDRIALGGGLAGSFPAFKESMFAVIEKSWGGQVCERIVPAELSNDAAIIGAAAVIKDKLAKDSDPCIG